MTHLHHLQISQRFETGTQCSEIQLWRFCQVLWRGSGLSLNDLVAQNAPRHPTVVLSSKRLTFLLPQTPKHFSEVAVLQEALTYYEYMLQMTLCSQCPE